MIQAGPSWPYASAGLANAVILASSTPSLLLGADLTVIVASRSFCRSFGVDPRQATLTPLVSLGGGEWGVPQLCALLQATASGFAAVDGYEMDPRREGYSVQHLLIEARKLDYPDGARTMVLVSIADITEAREREQRADRLMQEKAVLLRQLNHRVANSLQIIASVLVQSARRIQSDEARAHITDAHHRLMSVATLQRQLAVLDDEAVELAGYLAGLCRSIGASMIHDPALLAIRLDVDDSVVDADVSLSLGLIITELVVNALKHAFPGGRAGTIVVTYASDDERWTLCVGDDGIGMPADPEDAKAGLGSSIVRAVAMQLSAKIVIVATTPGTVVRVVHEAAEDAKEPLTLMAV